MTRIAILGDGLVGRSLADAMPDATLLGHADIEVTNPESVKRALAGRFDAAVNTVALHRLAACEDDPMLARLVNEIGARNVASVLPTVYISTDYVFSDGGPHDEALPGQEPRSVYGRTKLAGELATLEHEGIVVRVSAVFGHHRSHKGPSFPETITSSFDPIRLPTDQRFSPTYAPDAATRIADLARDLADIDRCPNCVTPWKCNGPHEPVNGIYHAANAGSTTWAEFAEHICAAVPWRRPVLPYAAHDRIRPANSSLRSTRLPRLPHWRLALQEWADRISGEIVISPKRSQP